MNKRLKGPRLILATLLALILFSINSCNDFFGTADLKETIEEDVAEAQAAEVDLTVQPDPDNAGGTTSLASTSQKVGQSFPISVTTFSDWSFTEWTELGGNNAVSFDSATSASTSATITREASGIIIQANFTRRPYIETSDPFPYATDVIKNKNISLYFSKEMNPATINFTDTVDITHKPIGSGDPATSIEDRYYEPVASPGNLLFTMSLKPGQSLSENHLVTVRVSRYVEDAVGNPMAADESITFQVGTSQDVTNPEWEATDPFTIRQHDGTALGANNSTNNPSVVLRPRAYDADTFVLYLRLQESGNAQTQTGQLTYATAIDYLLGTTGSGIKTLTAWIEDAAGNTDPGNTRTTTVRYDTGGPTVTSIGITPQTATPGGNEITGSPTVNVAIAGSDGALDDGNAGSGISSYMLIQATSLPATPGSSDSGWINEAPGTKVLTLTGIDGDKTVYLFLKDYAGNVSSNSQSDSITLDTTAPTVTIGTLTASGITSSSVGLAWNAAGDSGPGAVEYEVAYSESNNLTTVAGAEANDLGGVSWISATNGTVSGLDDGTLYYFNVIVRDQAGNKSLYTTASATTVDVTAPTPGGTPSGQLSFTGVGESSITVNWADANDNLTIASNLEYRAYYSTSNNIATVAQAEANGTPIGSDWATGLNSGTAPSLSPATTYYFNVLVRDQAGNSAAYTTASRATTDETPPDPGDSGALTFSGITDGSITVGWTAASDSVTIPGNLEYRAYYSTSNNIATVAQAEANGTPIGSDWATGLNSATAPSLSPATTYYFNVLVRDQAGNSAAYATAPRATTADVTPPIPGGSGTLTFSDVSTTSITVGWSEASDNGTSAENLEYRAYYSAADNIVTYADASTNGTLIGSGWATGITGAQQAGLTSGETYFFNVFVRDGAGIIAAYTSASQTTN